MSLYGLVFGRQQAAPVVLALLERAPTDFGRFRDAWIEQTEAGDLRLVVYTRCGGGNRESYFPKDIDQHPLYLSDQDDDFDTTYASIFFRLPDVIPARLLEVLPEELRTTEVFYETLKTIAIPPRNMREEWGKAIDAVGKAAPP